MTKFWMSTNWELEAQFSNTFMKMLMVPFQKPNSVDKFYIGSFACLFVKLLSFVEVSGKFDVCQENYGGYSFRGRSILFPLQYDSVC